jgi:prepilin-type N-terminal cleavage/methylation domain-containing protein
MKNNKKTGFTLVELLVVVSMIAIIIASCGGVCFNNPADGTKIGQIVKVTHSGILCKTWEAELIRGGMNNGSGAFGVQPFNFTISDDSTAGKVIQFMNDQTEVIIDYKTKGIYSPFTSDSHGNFLINIRSSKPEVPAQTQDAAPQ